MNKYILDDNGEPVSEADFMTWVKWIESCGDKRIVKRERIGSARVSTVFLGMDHGCGGGPPILWETMIFGVNPLEQDQWRCSGSREQALAMHAKVAVMAREVTEAIKRKTNHE